MSTGEPLDLDKIRARQKRALVAVSIERPNEHDPDKFHRAAYLLTVTDVPALLSEVERLRREVFTLTNSEGLEVVTLASERDALRAERDRLRNELGEALHQIYMLRGEW